MKKNHLQSIRILTIVIFTMFIFTKTLNAAFTEPTTAPSSSDQDFPQNILGANNNNNDFDSTNVTANNDGSLIERLEYIITSLSSLWTKVGNLLYYNTGNVGIGTSTPSALLEVSGDGQSALKVTDVTNSITTGIWSGTTQGSIGTLTNTDLRFLTNGTSKMTIDTSGNVGVGTTGPGQKLHIKDGISGTFLGISEDTVDWSVGMDNGSSLFDLKYEGTDYATFNSNGQTWLGLQGNVGIGTASPTYSKLQIHMATNNNIGLMTDDGYATISSFNDAINEYTQMQFKGGVFNFSGGNVGIGTTNPGEKLEVNGDVKITSTSGQLFWGANYVRWDGDNFEVVWSDNIQWEFRKNGTIWYYNGTTWVQKI